MSREWYDFFEKMNAEDAIKYIKEYPMYQQPEIIRIMLCNCENKDTLKAIHQYHSWNNTERFNCFCGAEVSFKQFKRHTLSLKHLLYNKGQPNK
jgi:hypothetical protein